MVTTFQTGSNAASHRHQESIAAILAHRIDVARTNNDASLLSVLEQERRQVESGDFDLTTPSDRFAGLKTWWLRLAQAIERQSQLSVEKMTDTAGGIWWRAYDPCTGKTLYTDSESEVVTWIEDNNLGR